jgi:hypothetical protein
VTVRHQSWRRPATALRLLAVALGAVLGLQLVTEQASARPFIKGMYESYYYSRQAQVRQHWFDETVRSNAGLVRLSMGWRHVVGDEPPANPSDPGDPAYDFSLFDSQVREATARGLTVLITVSGAPEWAEGRNPPNWANTGTWKPDPVAFGAFAEAVGRRYSGTYAPATGGGVLPRVEYFEAWNEPNQDERLAPQWEGGNLVGPDMYRTLLNQFYRGIKRTNPQALILGPATSPFGDDHQSPTRTRPLLFMRDLFCVNQALDPTNCPEPAMLDIVSHHPINFDNSPTDPPRHNDDIVIPNMKRIRPVVQAAQRAGNLVPGGRKPLWATELWWLTKPHAAGVSERRQAEYITEAFYRLWQQKVEALVWFELVAGNGFPSGLMWEDGRKKPGLTAFQFPFLAERNRKGKTTAWGIPPDSGKVKIQRQTGKRWRTIESVDVDADEPFSTKLDDLPRRADLRARLGANRSLKWRAR